MQRAVRSLLVAIVAAATVAACATRPDSGPGAEGPPLPRLAAALDTDPNGAPGAAPTVEVGPPRPGVASMQGAGEPTVPLQSVCPGPAGAMVLVDGDYCTDVRENCLEWEDPPANKLARCAKFGPSECVGERVHKRFCIDRDEYVAAGQKLPLSDVSWTGAQNVCQGEGKRLCKETEWEFACEGEQILPYPTGYDRDPKTCNFDKDPLLDRKGKLRDLREPEDETASCVSPFGARNMSGNVDEWVFRDRTYGEWRSALKGGWWMAARDRCRPATTAHDEHFHQLQTGVRCCSDVP
jgi:formylglycine-generating enzyme